MCGHNICGEMTVIGYLKVLNVSKVSTLFDIFGHFLKFEKLIEKRLKLQKF